MKNSLNIRPIIIVAAFSREKALLRLLDSLNNAFFEEKVKLIVSLDGGAKLDVINVAKSFEFMHGEYRVVERKENLGLRNHILWCGDQSNFYGAVIVLEDDLIVDRYFYSFAISALSFYQYETKVAGLALYAPQFNEEVQLPFEPMWNGTSTYPMALPCSWGQVWTKQQWDQFKSWYGNGERSKVDGCLLIPESTKNWPESSWKKYFSAYMAENALFFIYPYYSYTSNCSDSGGTHTVNGTSLYQVSLSDPSRCCESFVFKSFSFEELFYDAFMEVNHKFFSDVLNGEDCSLTIDLYGSKSKEILSLKQYCLTSRESNNPIKYYPLSFRPIELNVWYEPGEKNEYGIVLTRSEDINVNKDIDLAGFYEYWARFPIWSKKLFVVFLMAFSKKIFDRTIRFLFVN